MTAIAPNTDDIRLEAARLAFALIRFEELAAWIGPGLDLSPTSRILLEFDKESHVFSFAAVREWTQQFPLQVGWSVASLDGEDRADARMLLYRSDGKSFPGRSCMVPPRWGPPSGAA